MPMTSPEVSNSDEEEVQPIHREQLDTVMELAQICHFCNTFQTPLKLPVFSRTELQAALIAGTDGDDEQITLLAELHFKLSREATNMKMEKILQDWQKILMRKVGENWQLEFVTNPFDDATYADLSVHQRIQILNALCHWKLETCAEIHKYVATLQKEDEAKALETLRASPIGYTDDGVAYWYFNDGCWVYAEDQPTWQKDDRWRTYAVEFADAKRIRLSMNFRVDSTEITPILSNGMKSDKMDIHMLVDEASPKQKPFDTIKEEGATKSEMKKMDIGMLCGSPTVSDDQKSNESNGNHTTVTEVNHDSTTTTESVDEQKVILKEVELKTLSSDHVSTNKMLAIEKKVVFSQENTIINGTISTSKKRHIVDADKTDSSSDETSYQLKKSISRKKLRTESGAVTTIPDEVVTSTTTTEATNGIENDMKKELDKKENQEGNFDILCEACKRTYDRRYLDPPLDHRPHGEWRCFECLVNDARGWPRRRPSSRRSSRSDVNVDEPKEKSSSSRSSKRSSSKKPSSSKKSSSSRHKKSSHSSSKKSSSKKHKKKKSSSSSHRSSSHRHRYREEYSTLLESYQGRKRDRLRTETSRMESSYLCPLTVECPTGWRVMSSSVETLRQLTLQLVGGTLEQERLRGRLIVILKTQEKIQEEQLKKRELMWQLLPRRQSSRVAIGRIMHQSAKDGESEEDEEETGRSHRSTRATSTGYDSRQQLALERESRARRRHVIADSDDSDEEETETPPVVVDAWMDWSNMQEKRLTTVCLAMVERLLKEDISELFARPVDPEEDGCPDYLSVIEHPIDLGTIRQRAQSEFYKSWSVFKIDLDRVWGNCRAYNSPDTVVVHYANTLDKMVRVMCKEAERKGVHKLNETPSEGHGMSSANVSETESRGSVTKSWSGSASSDSDASSDEDSENGHSSDNSAGEKSSKRKLSRPSSASRSSRVSRRSVKRSTPSSRKYVDSDDESEPSTEDDEASEEEKQSTKRMGLTRENKSKQSTSPLPPSKKPHGRNRIDSSESSSSDKESSSDDSDEELGRSLKQLSETGKPTPPSRPIPPPPSTPPPPPSAPLSKPPSPGSSSSSYFSSSDSNSSEDGNNSDSD